ncbi:MAG: hypothetical protein M1830_002201, partial [Pleopsidium flavum]
EETGGSLSICVLGGDWRFPDEGQQRNGKTKAQTADEGVSEPVEPAERPDVDELITLVENVIAQLPDNGPDQ